MRINDKALSQVTDEYLSRLPLDKALRLCRFLAEDLRELRGLRQAGPEHFQGEVPVEEVNLEAGEHLSDRPPEIRGRRVVIEGDTGIGKTRYVLGPLAANRPVVLLVPSIAQVKQIESRYPQGEKDHPGGISFVHGQSKPDRLGGTVVATYDQLGYIARTLGEERSRYLLVVDEVHNVYQAGSYRATALQGVLDAIDVVGEPGGFAGLLGLSATLQPELLDWAFDQSIIVHRAEPLARAVEIVEYEKGVKLDALLTVLLREDELLPKTHLNVIRHDHRDELDILAETFQKYGYRCVVAHSRNQDEAEVQEMLITHRVTGHDLLLTTRLLDEGIDIENDDLGCLHLIGQVHSAELRQFLGRFRRSNPKVFLHIDACGGDVPWHEIEGEGRQAQNLQSLMYAFWAASLEHAAQRGRKDPTAKRAAKHIKELNATHRFLCEFDLLTCISYWDGSWEVVPNRPGRLAYLYRLDLENHYHSRDVLRDRVLNALGNGVVNERVIGRQESDETVANTLWEAERLVQERGRTMVEEIAAAVRAEVEAGTGATEREVLNRLAESVRNEKTEQAAVVGALVYFTTEIAANFQAAVDMLASGQATKVTRFVKGLDDHLVRAFHDVLTQYCKAAGSGSGGSLEIPKTKGRELVLEAVDKLSRANPDFRISALLRGDERRGVIPQKDGTYHVTSQFVRMMFEDFTDSHKVKEYYEFDGIAWGGFEYARLMKSAEMPKRASKSAEMPKRASKSAEMPKRASRT